MPPSPWLHQPISSLSGLGIDKPLRRQIDEIVVKLLKQNRLLHADLKKDVHAIEKVQRVMWRHYDEFPAEFRRGRAKDYAMSILYGRCKEFNGQARKEASSASEAQPSQSVTSQPKDTKTRGESQGEEGEAGGPNNLKKEAEANDTFAEYILVVVDSAGSSITSCCRMTDICRVGDTSLARQLSYSTLMAVLREDFEGTKTDVDACRIVYHPKTGVPISIRNSRQLRTVVQIAQAESPQANIINMSLEPNELQLDDKPARPSSPHPRSDVATLIELTPQQHKQQQTIPRWAAELNAPQIENPPEACTGPTPIARAAAQLRQSRSDGGSLTADQTPKGRRRGGRRVAAVTDFRETVTQQPGNGGGGINKTKHDVEAPSCPQQ